MAGLTRSSKVTSRAPSPTVRRRGMLVGMAKPLAKIVAVLTPLAHQAALIRALTRGFRAVAS